MTPEQIQAVQTAKISDTVLAATQSLIQYLEGHTTKAEIVNQLESIKTPDVKSVVEALSLLDKSIKERPLTDLSGVTELMQELVTQAKLIPKTLPEEKDQPFIDYTKQLSGLLSAIKAIESVVKAQKPPVVNVPETKIDVAAPDLKPLQQGFKDVVASVRKIVIPEYKTDNTAVEKLLKKSNKLLDQILDKPVGGGGGGGGYGGSLFIDDTGNKANVTLTSGRIPVDLGATSITIGSEIEIKNDTGNPVPVALKDTLGNSTNSAGNGFIKITDEPRQVFYDSFDAALDTTNMWTSTQGSSGVAGSVTTGEVSMGTGTAANGYSKLTSIPSFKPTIPGWVVYSDAIKIPDAAAPTANALRLWGSGTTPATPTKAAPITDGFFFELDGSVLAAVVYAGGIRTQIATGLTLATAYQRYIIQVRTDRTYFYIGGIDSASLVATTAFQSPQAQINPKLFLCVGGSTPPASNAQILCTGAVVSDTGKNASQIADGTFPWRRAQVSPQGAIATGSPILATRVDNTSTTNVVYIGNASVGSATSSAVWQIKKLDKTSGLIKTWAGSGNYTQIWNNRVGLTYA